MNTVICYVYEYSTNVLMVFLPVPVSITQLLKALVLLVVDPGMSAAHRRVEKDKGNILSHHNTVRVLFGSPIFYILRYED